MSFFGQNVKKIRKIKQLSQSQFADLFGLTRASIGAYEEGRSEAKIDTIIQIANHFSISVDSLLRKQLTVNDLYHFDIVNKDLDRYHHIKENGTIADFAGIPLVSDKIYLDYIKNIDNPEFIHRLPKIKLPIDNAKNMRAFVQLGNSMQFNNSGVFHGDLVVVEKGQFGKLEKGKLVVLIVENQVYLRRFLAKEDNIMIYESDNIDYEPIRIDEALIKEIWIVKYLITKHVSSNIKSTNRLDELERRLNDLETRIK